MECERLPEESAVVTVMVWSPVGVPGFVTGLEGEDELQPENESKPAANKNVSRLARVRRRLSPNKRRGIGLVRESWPRRSLAVGRKDCAGGRLLCDG